MSLHIVILAAGAGKRMHSSLPKVLHHVGGKPMLEHVLELALGLKPEGIHIIIGHGGDKVRAAFPHVPVHWIHQQEQLGTGHALMQALPHIPETSLVLVLYGDVPLLPRDLLLSLITKGHSSLAQGSSLVLLLANLPDPTGLGRIIRDEQQRIVGIVEEKDASVEERLQKEIYSGICCVSAACLNRWLPQLQPHNAQGEYYLTDIVKYAVVEGLHVGEQFVIDPLDICGVNDKVHLQHVERIWQSRVALEMMLQGVTLADSDRIDVRGELTVGKDVFIDFNTLFEGKVVIGAGSHIGPNCSLKNVTLGTNCDILAHCVLEDCHVGDHCQIGPFARLRPGTHLEAGCKIGNFVETKNASFGRGCKANHLSYLGDVTMGEHVNIGAGTITCNYDGAYKHQTTIEDDVFVGSDTQLIAPVTVGKNATIAAGSTIRKNVPPNGLTLTEAKQKTIPGWVRPKKNQP
ncbi:MAG: bifunctional UDP-N-acetylglucosamine diphosphorylase/glucosamine-1-phosphate N-acetyltransferase GlmU [Legionellales bacterium]|nr:bifunctional UDP-N-acetylglucosamine diphosphorylase/glucosamine-1-phosphate N-acetyltransferase GlmU [Legionellales bacterium]